MINSEVSAYVFINKFFTQQHHFFLHQLIHSCRLQEFNDQVVLINDITYVVKITMILDEHIEKLFFYVIDFFSFFIKCMQSMTMTLFKRCMYVKLHVIWSKSLLYIFLLINHIDSLCIQAFSFNFHHYTFVFLCFFAFFAFYSFVSNSHFLVVIQVFFKYFSVAILSILMMNNVIIVSVFLSWAFFLSFICSTL